MRVSNSRNLKRTTKIGKYIQGENDEELVCVNENKKKEEGEGELLVPFLLHSMFDKSSPSPSPSPTGVGALSDGRYGSKIAYSALPDHLMMPTLSTFPYEDLGEDALQQESSFSSEVVTTSVDRSHPFFFPEDIQYGELTFRTSYDERTINVRSFPIFLTKSPPRKTRKLNFAYIEEQSFSYDSYGGVEESKEEEGDDDRSNEEYEPTQIHSTSHLAGEYRHGDLNRHCAKDRLENETISPQHSSISTPRRTAVKSKFEAFIESVTNMFACGEYGKAYSSKSLVSEPCRNSLYDEPCLAFAETE